MRTQITTAIAMLFSVVGMANSAQAQVQSQVVQQPQQVQQAYVVPGYQSPPVAPPQQNQFYFGVNVQLNHGYHGTSLRITSVTPGSPASAAGLEIGDEIRSINGRSFEQARDSFHAVRMMNRFVSFNGPAVPAAAASAGVQAYVMPRPAPPQAFAQLLVRNVRNGQYPHSGSGLPKLPSPESVSVERVSVWSKSAPTAGKSNELGKLKRIWKR